jgi:hypothetical protein
MAALGSQSIASSYEQLLHVDADGGGNSTTHVSVKDGDNGTTFGFTIASDALMMSSTNRLEFGDNGTYIHQSGDGVLAVASDGGINVSLGSSSGNDFNIDSGGFVYEGDNNRVGIGTDSPDDRLHILGSLFLEDGSPEITFETSGSGHENWQIAVQETVGNSFQIGEGSQDSDASNDTFTPRMVIKAGGDIGIQDNTPSKALDIKNGSSGGDILCYDIYTHDGGAETSDERMKENIVDSALGLDFVKALKPRSYKWKDTPEYTDDDGNYFEAVTYERTHYGMVSQEVKQTMDDLGLSDKDFAGYIYEEDRDKFGLRYSEFISPLIKAIQELSAKVEALEG